MMIDDEYGGGNTSNNLNNTNGTATSFASTFRSNPGATRTTEDLRKARESRAADALQMKDEQINILTAQNNNLLQSMDKLEEDLNNLQLQKLSVEQENRSVRDSNFELQSKARSAETISKRCQAEVADKDKQLRIMTDQNTEMLRLLEAEEVRGTQLDREVAELRSELDELRQKHGALLATAKTHEELATKAAKEGQLRAEEIRLLRVETEQLKQQNTELKMKTQVEVEALQEQLRVRKEKQYQLLEKLQAQEEAKRQAEDQVAGMEEQLRGLHARNVDLETQMKVESRGRANLEESNRELQTENNNLYNNNKELQNKISKSETERLRLQSEGRDISDNMHEVSQKVFQLMERLKLAELGKSKAMEALKKKEQDMISIQKKNARLIKEATEEAKARTEAETNVKLLQDQIRIVKKNNTMLTQKSKEEASAKVKALEEIEQLNEKNKAMEARLSFLLNKVQSDEENRVIQAEDRKKLEAQVLTYSEKCEEIQRKLIEIGESNRIITQALRLKQDEYHELMTKYDHLQSDLRELNALHNNNSENPDDLTGARPGGPDDIENVRLNEGRGRFYVHALSIGGGSMLQIKSRKPLFRQWLERKGLNSFLKMAQQTPKFRDLVVEKLCAVYGLLMVEEEEKQQYVEAVNERDQQLVHIQKKIEFIQNNLAVEEDAKRRMLLRYIHAVKEHALSVNGGTGGVLQLPESNITDEEIHALCALLRNNMSIDELNLRGNSITDDGARALGAVLAGRSGLKLVDLRGNKIGQGAIRVLAEALERAERVRHVYVHAGGKIEALGAGRWANPRTDSTNTANRSNEEIMSEHKNAATVETVCVVDIRDNTPEQTSFPYELEKVQIKIPNTTITSSHPTTGKSIPLKTSTSPAKRSSNATASTTDAPDQHNTTSANSKLKNKMSKMLVRSVNNMVSTSASSANLDLADKKAHLKAHQDFLRAQQEAGWQGRAEGRDARASLTQDLEKSLSFVKRKKGQRGELAPLSASMSNNMSAGDGRSPSRGHSAPDLHQSFGALQLAFPDEPEGIMTGHPSASTITGMPAVKNKKEKKEKKYSKLEEALKSNPLGQPLVKN